MEKILHLTLKKQWFDLIRSGQKKQEFREVKPHWFSRLVDYDKQEVKENYDNLQDYMDNHFRICAYNVNCECCLSHSECDTAGTLKDFDEVHFKNGYAKDAPFLKVECLSIDCQNDIKTPLGIGNFFVINLGEIL